MSHVAYLTDIEGLWQKLVDFANDNPWVALDGDRLRLAPDAIFVFGGDAIDRGPWSRRVVSALLDAKSRYGERVVLLAGNRDINKMRLVRELGGAPPARAPREVVEAGRVVLLRWIFENTMGAKRAFAMRREELGQGEASVSDEDVVESFAADLAPDGALTRYLGVCQLAYRHEQTLFVHGAVTDESLGVVPGAARRSGDPDAWITALNSFYRAQIDAFVARRLDPQGEPLWASLVAYQSPLPGTRLNQASVVYGRPADALGNPVLPSREVIEALQRAGIGRVVVGHTPSGDSPSVLCDKGFQLVIADNSYGRVERGTQLHLEGEVMGVIGRAALDEDGEHAVRFEVVGFEGRGPIGLRDAPTGRLVKGRLDSGEYLSFRFLAGFEVEQRAVSAEACARLPLVVPRAGAGAGPR